MTNTKQPIYKQLNEQRTQGKWDYEYDNNDFGQFYTIRNNDLQDVFYYSYRGFNDDEYRANAAYTCLAVNNLHQLAEALEACKNELESHWDAKDKDSNTYLLIEMAKEALNRIS